MHQIYPFLHADEPQPSILRRLFRVKAYARICHLQLNLIRRCAQIHFELIHPAVLHCVLQCFLRNAEETQ